MHIALVAEDVSADEFLGRSVSLSKQVFRYASLSSINKEVDAVFYLYPEEVVLSSVKDLSDLKGPVVVNCVAHTLQDLPANVSRINAWPGFLDREIVEVAARDFHIAHLEKIFGEMGWKPRYVADEPGMVAARIIAMIINEAWFALEDGVSAKQDIDTAMKLGTNYPWGPFEWGEKIGLDKIIKLLQQLARQNSRYAPASLLLKQIDS